MESIDHAGFARAYTAEGAFGLARALGVSDVAARQRARRARQKGYAIPKQKPGPGKAEHYAQTDKLIALKGGLTHHAPRLSAEIETGTAVVFSDAHYWPGPATTMHRALVQLVHEAAPDMLFVNGDAVDMANASRHAPIGWETRPTIQQEIEAAQLRLSEIKSPSKMRQIWLLGNHDARFETQLASKAPEYAMIKGIHLHDHFPGFDRGWSVFVNDNVVIKHRAKKRKSTLYAGKTMVTGHFHSARVEPHTDYNGTRFDVDTGCLADIYGDQFNYMEDNVRDWVSAFALLTFKNGRLLWPELVTKWDEEHVQFRGKIIKV